MDMELSVVVYVIIKMRYIYMYHLSPIHFSQESVRLFAQVGEEHGAHCPGDCVPLAHVVSSR